MFGFHGRRDRAVEAIESEMRDLRASLDVLAKDRASEAAVGQSRRRAVVWVGAVLACVFTAASIGLVAVSLPSSPTAPDQGRIGVVMPEDPDGTVQVYASFSGSLDSKSRFELVVSVFPPAESSSSGTSVGIFFCGAIREGLKLRQANTNDIPSPVPVEQDVLEADSRLGERSECEFVSVTSDNFQVILFGESDHSSVTTAGKKALYVFPGVATTVAEENVNGMLMRPLPRDSTLDVVMTDVPPDLTVSASAPQIPPDGNLAWPFADIRSINAPSEYRISGVLGDRENTSQALLFTAGALIGLAGAALLWALEGIVEITLIRRRSRIAA